MLTKVIPLMITIVKLQYLSFKCGVSGLIVSFDFLCCYDLFFLTVFLFHEETKPLILFIRTTIIRNNNHNGEGTKNGVWLCFIGVKLWEFCSRRVVLRIDILLLFRALSRIGKRVLLIDRVFFDIYALIS